MNSLLISVVSLIVVFLFFHGQKKNSWYAKFLFPAFFLYLGAVEAESIVQALLFGASAVFAFLAFTHFDENNAPQMNYNEPYPEEENIDESDELTAPQEEDEMDSEEEIEEPALVRKRK
ncbi:MAG: hypothetical protein JW703_04250 [Candidatus Diapherotrites archaeon]|nr:hypothetical protein [Candidatus Diapherotrites archaeon]